MNGSVLKMLSLASSLESLARRDLTATHLYTISFAKNIKRKILLAIR